MATDQPEEYRRRYFTFEMEVLSAPDDPTSDYVVARAIVEELEGMTLLAAGRHHTIDEAQEPSHEAEAAHERAQEAAIARREEALDATEEAVVWGPGYE